VRLTRRRLLFRSVSLALVSGAAGLLAACQSASVSSPTPATKSTQPTAVPALATSTEVTQVAQPVPTSAGSPTPVAAPAEIPTAASARATTPVAIAPAAGKPMYQHDPQHTGRSPYAGPKTAGLLRRFDASAPANLPPDATIPRSDFQSSSAVGPDGTIYIANFPGVLFALRDGTSARDQLEVAWRFHPPTSSSFHATPALSADGSTVYLGFASGGFNAPGKATLYALKAPTSGQDPQVSWTVDMGDARVMASPTVGPDGTVYVANSSGLLFAVSPEGQVRWTAQTGSTIKSAPAIGPDGSIYHATSDGKMYALSAQGQQKWAFDFGEHLGPTPLMTSQGAGPGGGGGANGIGTGASPTVSPDGTIFIGANNSNMYAVQPNGSLKWLFEAERELAGIWTTPVLSADASTIYFGANKGGVYALNTSDGSRRWQFQVYGSIYASSVIDAQGVLYTATTIEHVYAVDSARGEQIWDYDAHNAVWTAPSIRPDGTIVIADRGGLVQVLG
jgi:outer membrane protein assembly factor BamB